MIERHYRCSVAVIVKEVFRDFMSQVDARRLIEGGAYLERADPRFGATYFDVSGANGGSLSGGNSGFAP